MAAPARSLVLLVLCALSVGACGQSTKDSAQEFKGDQKAVAQTVEDLQEEGAKRSADSARKICRDLLTSELVARIKKASRTTCDDRVKELLGDADAFELQVTQVSIDGAQATAVVESQASDDQNRTDRLTLQKVGRTWKIAALGGAQAVPE